VNVRVRRDAGPFQSRPHRLADRPLSGGTERGDSSSGGEAARLPEGASLPRCWRKAADARTAGRRPRTAARPPTPASRGFRGAPAL